MEKIVMNRVIMIKYGELTTKKSNRKLFINALYNNILNKLAGMNVHIIKDISRMYIEFNQEDLNDILKKINHVFGIHSYLVSYKLKSDINDINTTILNIISSINFKTFKVETKRSDKNFPILSTDFSKKIGGLILKNKKDIKVDVHNPEITFHIEIRSDYTYIYMNEYSGIGGYPVGTLGKGLLMLSGGIDSPVSGYLALKRGVKLDAVYFEAIPHTSLEARDKVIQLSHKLLEYSNITRIDTYSEKHGTRITTYCARCIENEILMYYRSDKKNSKNISINESVGFDKDGNEITFLDILKTPKPDFALDIHKQNNIDSLKKYFNVLNEREKEIIIKRYGLNDQDEKTQKEIAKELGISRSYVSRIEKRALTKMLREFIKNKNH